MSKHCDGVITGPVTDGLKKNKKQTNTRLNYQYQKLRVTRHQNKESWHT